MQELTQLNNTQTEECNFCRDCEYQVVLWGNSECEWDLFESTPEAKANLYTPVDYDCIHYSKRG